MRAVVLPPRPVRRLVLGPAMVLATAALVAATPIVVMVLAFGVRFIPGRWRPLRLFWFLLMFMLRESVCIVAMAALWVLSGFGWKLHSDRFQRAHVALIGWYLHTTVTAASRGLGLTLWVEAVPDSLAIPRAPAVNGATVDPPRPVLVFSRHAGAGDSLVLVHLLVNIYGRRPRIVLKDLLQLDPCIDIGLNRLPSRFIGPGRDRLRRRDGMHSAADESARREQMPVVESIRELAAGLEPDGAFILFPEGGNFSESRRHRAIERLVEAGMDETVRLARELTYVLPPRPRGAFAAIDAAPDADVLFVAHTGLEQLSGLRDLWKGLPMDREVRLTWWHVQREEIPSDPDERILWLYEWWERIDTWIEERRVPGRPATPALLPEERT